MTDLAGFGFHDYQAYLHGESAPHAPADGRCERCQGAGIVYDTHAEAGSSYLKYRVCPKCGGGCREPVAPVRRKRQ